MLLLALTLGIQQVNIGTHDGHPVFAPPLPVQWSKEELTVKEMAAVSIPWPARVVGIRFAPTSMDQPIRLHFWRDIDRTTQPYWPFRDFEFDIVSPINVDSDMGTVDGHWKYLDLRSNNADFTVENPTIVIVGWYAEPGRARVRADRSLESPLNAAIEVFDKSVRGRREIELYNPTGDYCVELVVERIEEPSKWFEDVTEAVGLEDCHSGPIAWVDIDFDGWDDLVVAGKFVYKNFGGRFLVQSAITIHDGEPGFARFADVNGDRLPDAIVYSENRTKMFVNKGSMKFGPDTQFPEIEGVAMTATWLDIDRDGWIDLYVGLSQSPNHGADKLIRNVEGKSWSVVDDDEWIDPNPGFTRVACAADLDGDGYPELFVGSYSQRADRFYTRKDGKWENIADSIGLAFGTSPAGGLGGTQPWGAGFVDVNSDGLLDLFTANLVHPDWRGSSHSVFSRLFLSKKQGSIGFEPLPSHNLGIWYEETPADPVWGDFDGDGDLDVLIMSAYHTANFFENRDGTFADVTYASQVRASKSVHAACADFDRDGRLDLAVIDDERGLRLYRNVTNARPLVAFRFESEHESTGIGVQLVSGDSTKRTRYVIAGSRGGKNQDSAAWLIAFPQSDRMRTVDVLWPNGIAAKYDLSPLTNLHTIVYSEKKPFLKGQF
ncbi:MAG: VCBS repeat-containing protein [Fimbriimonadales bacterium]|nr:VCBS repeat-containing protein [Fimbriimonadales bacterium]